MKREPVRHSDISHGVLVLAEYVLESLTTPHEAVPLDDRTPTPYLKHAPVIQLRHPWRLRSR